MMMNLYKLFNINVCDLKQFSFVSNPKTSLFLNKMILNKKRPSRVVITREMFLVNINVESFCEVINKETAYLQVYIRRHKLP